MGMIATGTIVQHCDTGAQYAFCLDCTARYERGGADVLMIMGPLFADPAQWDCIGGVIYGAHTPATTRKEA